MLKFFAECLLFPLYVIDKITIPLVYLTYKPVVAYYSYCYNLKNKDKIFLE